MNFWEWFGLIGMILPILAVVSVFRLDLVFFLIGPLFKLVNIKTLSEGIWHDWDNYKAGIGPYPNRMIYLPVSIGVAGIVSGICLYIHLAAG
jgi:hypothetical protein